MGRRWFDVDIVLEDSDGGPDRWIITPPSESGTAEPIGDEWGYLTLAEAVAVVEKWATQRELRLPYLLTIQVTQDVPDETSGKDD